VQQNTPLGTLPCTYSITSSARPSNESGKLIPSVLAVLALITNLTLVPCITGRSALENTSGVHAHLSIRISIAESVAHQAANLVAWAIWQHSVSCPRSSNRTCRFPASGFPTSFIVRHTEKSSGRKRPLRGGFSPSPYDTAFSEGSGSFPVL
jgi:hypothetical protein